jgi:hypothetical protein
MALSTRQKTLVVVLGLGLGSLTVDRLLLSDSQTAPSKVEAAANVQALTDSPPAPAARPAAEGNSTLLDDSLAARLESLASLHQVDRAAANDAFCASREWLAELKPENPISSDEVLVQEFAQKHRLQAVVMVLEGGSAIIDGQPITVGQTFDGFHLSAVGDRSATFVCNKAAVTLRMDVGYKSN